MSTTVSDISGNRNDKIANAAKVLGRAPQRKLVFSKIYSGKKTKTVSELVQLTGLNNVRVLQEAKKLAVEDIVAEIKRKGEETAYKKIDFYNHHKKTIIKLAGDKRKLEKFPTKVTPFVNGKMAQGGVEKLILPKKLFNAVEITIDDIDSFKKVRKINNSSINIKGLSETDFKKGIQKILGERGVFKDWGGEPNDLMTTKVLIKNKRTRTAFAFKGPGKKGKLTPAMMGKNGDQIQRLFNSPGELFVVQYWDQIEQSVTEQVQTFAKMKSAMENGKKIFYCIIDGQDTKRIIESYPQCFRFKK